MVDNSNDDGSDSKGFNYDSLVEESLKNVVKKVLKITSETGLIGNSHFFISFNGDDPDVVVPSELKSTDSSEIKIIIQHQFWDLKSTHSHFEVTVTDDDGIETTVPVHGEHTASFKMTLKNV